MIIERGHSTFTLLRHAFHLHQAGRLAEARSIYEKIIKRSPKNFDALQLLAALHAQENDYPAALQLLSRAITINKKSAIVFINRANVLRKLMRLEESLDDYSRALAIEPRHPSALSGLGATLYELERYEEALNTCNSAIAADRKSHQARLVKANALVKMAQFDEALKFFDEALKLNPRHYDTLVNKGHLLQELRRFHDALSTYDEAIRLDPDGAEAHWGKALMFLRTGNMQDGWKLYEYRLKKRRALNNYIFVPNKLWIPGYDVRNKLILIHCEQGLGD